MNITINQLKGLCPTQSTKVLNTFITPLNEYLPKYGIDSVLRVQHFLAQAAHETCAFQFLKELASGKAYEGRKDLGNTQPGDGVKYKGRGIFQTTGRSNYKLVSEHIFGDDRLIEHPELLEQPINAVISACYYWQSHGLSDYADKDNVITITKKINGGTNGLPDRVAYLNKAKQFIKTI